MQSKGKKYLPIFSDGGNCASSIHHSRCQTCGNDHYDVRGCLGSVLSGKHSMKITQARYTLIRDYLITHMINNANRAGAVAFMTVQEIWRAKLEDDRYVVEVLDHMTVDFHGPTQVVLAVHLYNCLSILKRRS